MKDSIRMRLESVSERREEVGVLMGDPDVLGDQDRFRALSKEYAKLEPVTALFEAWRTADADLAAAREMAADPELADMAAEERPALEATMERLEDELAVAMLPTDPLDDAGVFFEIRAGTGGDEAAIFAGDLLKMYLRHAENAGWRSEVVTERPGDHGGYKEVVCRLSGDAVYSRLKFESGAHRVQRVPETESQGRVHTSAATVAILPEVAEVEGIEIASADLRVDTFRASGAGGQHVNKTESRVELVFDFNNTELLDEWEKRNLRHHLGRKIDSNGIISVVDQSGRSQHKNRTNALRTLKDMLELSSRPVPKKHKGKAFTANRRKRLDNKKRRAEIKAGRGKIRW